MSCQFCLGFCAGSKAFRETVSIFDGEDDALLQATTRAEQLPHDEAATNLRMFFCLEVAQLFTRRKCEEIADTCGLEGTVTPPWIRQPFTFTHKGLVELLHNLADLDELLVALDLEMGMRKEGNVGAATADLYSSGLMSAPLRESVTRFHRIVKKIDLAMRREERPYYALGVACTHLFDSFGAMAQDYITLANVMFNITSTETVSPWTTKIPFL